MSELRWSDGLLEAGFGDPEMARCMSWPVRIERMVEVEAALARALANLDLIPGEAADAIGHACDVAGLDLDELARQAAASPTPVIPLVRALSKGANGPGASWLHHGATSQDIIDTATTLQLRHALAYLDTLVLGIGERCAELAATHRGTVMAGRTLGQQATPITFGLKAARWLGALDRHLEQLRWLQPRILTVQLGGAAGTTAVYGPHGRGVTEVLADELGLGVPDLPWHAERDRIVELAGALTGIVATTASIAGDLVLLAQTEVGEVREHANGSPTSSAMPHKRNPIHAVATRAASRLALGDLHVLTQAAADHENERAAGAWQAEWVALPSALTRTAGSLIRLDAALDGLEFDADRARDNLERSLGLTSSEALATALTPALGRPRAQHLVSELVAHAGSTHRQLAEVAAADPEVSSVLDAGRLTHILDPVSPPAHLDELIDRALARHAHAGSGPSA